MNVLFVHQNFPGQFRHLAPALAARGHRVVALGTHDRLPRDWRGLRYLRYPIGRGSTRGIHPWVVDLETKVIRGQACYRAARKLQEAGFSPDVIVAHSGWGESLFLKQVWPQARLHLYCEFYYRDSGADYGFDPEFPPEDEEDRCRLHLKNVNNLLHFEQADAAVSPTRWQADSFPEPFRSRISVIHDGIDTGQLAPREEPVLHLETPGGRAMRLSREDEVVTFVARNLEPYRGVHTFLRALPQLLRERPRAQVLVVGADGVSYGRKPTPERDGASTWKAVFLEEIRPRLSEADWQRVHFPGTLPREHFTAMLQVSRVHVYLTYPFVLSWSLLEAMSVGCAIIASDTAPVREVIEHERQGVLVDFFDSEALVRAVVGLLQDEPARQRLGAAARQRVVDGYDLQRVCLPALLDWVQNG